MRYVGGLFILLLLVQPASGRAGEICAASFDELGRTERLSTIQHLFKNNSRLGMVNETEGSYLVMETLDGKLKLTFYTSGVFNLYGVKREGPLVFCDTGSTIKLIGIGREEELAVSPGGILKVGSGGPRMLFHAGLMPEPLKVLHHIVERGLASDP